MNPKSPENHHRNQGFLQIRLRHISKFVSRINPVRVFHRGLAIGKRSIISVAIITSDDFNASKRVDYESVMLGGVLVENAWRGVGHPMCSESDVNGDGKFDLVCKFDAGKLKHQPGKQMIELTGKTIGGEIAITGQDHVNAVQD